MAKQYDLLIRVILIGDTGVGKTCLLCRYVDDQFQANCSATIGIDFKVKNVRFNGKRVRLQIWDTAGQERFETLTKQYYRRAQGVLLVYDISSVPTFDHMARWVAYVKEFCKNNVEVALVGNKNDLEEWRQVAQADGLSVFKDLIQRIINKHTEELAQQKLESLPSSDSESEFSNCAVLECEDVDAKLDQRHCCHSL